MANSKRYSFRRIVPLACVVAGLGTLAALVVAHEWGNFRVVSPGRCYRSAHLDRDELVRSVRKYGIRTVINLRGPNPEEEWYLEETEICRELGVVYYDIPLRSTVEPTDGQIAYLINLFEHSEEPVLLHCRSGIDRAGLASAIWLMVMEGAEKAVARKQLSWRYGYLPILGKSAMQGFIDRWRYPPKRR